MQSCQAWPLDIGLIVVPDRACPRFCVNGLAVELRPRGIRVNAARLGAIDTPLLWSNPNVRSGKEKIDRASIGTPLQVAQAILFLASSESSFTTGAILNVDGGRLADL